MNEININFDPDEMELVAEAIWDSGTPEISWSELDGAIEIGQSKELKKEFILMAEAGIKKWIELKGW